MNLGVVQPPVHCTKVSVRWPFLSFARFRNSPRRGYQTRYTASDVVQDRFREAAWWGEHLREYPCVIGESVDGTEPIHSPASYQLGRRRIADIAVDELETG